jgi:dihydropteroate synthase
MRRENSGRRKFVLNLRSTVLVLGERTLVMGVLNVTPDSFSDGGRFLDPERAVAHALEMERAGADIIDIGAESARPGSRGISAGEELERLLPVLRRLKRRLRVPLSVDTTKAEVAAVALEAGAQMVNDISALRFDGRLAEVAKRYEAPLVLMHMRGTPLTMQQIPPARNIWREIERDLRRAVALALRAGLRRTQLLIDPGIGFGKTVEQNLAIIRELRRLEKFNLPVLIGTSRKTFIGKILDNAPTDRRLLGTAATVTAAIVNGAHVVRVHDVAEMVQVVRITDALLRA